MSLLPIQIPTGYTLSVQSGETVVAGQVLARLSSDASLARIPVASLLRIPPKKIKKYLRKNPGDMVKNGEIIAVKASFISLSELVSQIAGTVLSIDETKGDLILEKTGQDVVSGGDVVSPFAGVVTEVQEGSVTLSTKDGGLVGTKGTGGSAKGQLYLIDTGQQPVEGAHITVAMIGNIVLGSLFSKEALVKASGMGVAGVVSLKIDDADIMVLEQKRMLLPILEVDLQTWQSLAKQAGKNVYLDSVAKTILVS